MEWPLSGVQRLRRQIGIPRQTWATSGQIIPFNSSHRHDFSLRPFRLACKGVSGATHLFNAMSQLSAREPGLVGAALQDDRLFAGIICDGVHVDRTSLRIAFQCKGRDRLMLITDATPLVGTHDQEFMLHGMRIALHENRLTSPDGTLAGANLTMIEAVRNAVAQ
jgi:N-acetylglucosamine-6-phosphate deacetylase